MASRPNIQPNILKPLIDAVSMATSITGRPTNIQYIPGISYDLVWTGTPVGTFSVQVSNTYAQNPDGSVEFAGNWTTLPPSSFTGNYPAPSGTADAGFLDVVGTECAWIRLVYNATSGTGTLTAVPCAKVL